MCLRELGLCVIRFGYRTGLKPYARIVLDLVQLFIFLGIELICGIMQKERRPMAIGSNGTSVIVKDSPIVDCPVELVVTGRDMSIIRPSLGADEAKVVMNGIRRALRKRKS